MIDLLGVQNVPLSLKSTIEQPYVSKGLFCIRWSHDNICLLHTKVQHQSTLALCDRLQLH